MEIPQSTSTISPSNDPPQHTYHTFAEPRQPNIYFSSNFCSGNLNRVVRSAYDHYSLWTACDAQGTENEGYPKSWFYFEVGGFQGRRVSFSVHRLHFLFAMVKRSNLYRPVYRVKNEDGSFSQWDRLPYPILSLALNSEQQLVLKFDFYFPKPPQTCINSVQFAFIYPYSYEDCRKDILKLQEDYEGDRQLMLERYELAKSYEGRIIDLLMVSSHQGKEGYQNFKAQQRQKDGFKATQKHFPLIQQKLTKFRSNKPIIFISARVHPIQTPSSYTLNGILMFLLSKNDYRAYLLRKYFVFILVPMLNPDGVTRGHCRMDALNQNLNRYYSTPDMEKQPGCYAVKKLCEYYMRDKRLFMYLDLHAHPAFKGNFTFGNAIYDFIQQVESQLFPKVLAQNCISFEFQQCIFSRKHMKAKDRFEDVSKEGCGRVVFYKEFGLVHSYTLECGYHCNSFDNVIGDVGQSKNKKFAIKYRVNQKGEKIYGQQKQWQGTQEQRQRQISKNFEIFEYTSDPLDNKDDEYYKRQLPIYTQQTFYNLGRNILISLLDIWQKNPYSCIPDLATSRKEIADKQAKLDRFRKEQSGIKAKQKRVVQLIEQQLYGQWKKRNVFNVISSVGGAAGNMREKKRNHTLQYSNGRTGYKTGKESKPQIDIERKQENSSVNIIPNSQTSNVNTQSKPQNLHESQQSFCKVESTLTPPEVISIQGKNREQKTQSNLPISQPSLLQTRIFYSKGTVKRMFQGGLNSQMRQLNMGRERVFGKDNKLIPFSSSINKDPGMWKVGEEEGYRKQGERDRDRQKQYRDFRGKEHKDPKKQIKHDAMSLSSKVIKNPVSNLANLRVRNLMIAGNGNNQCMVTAKK